MRVRLWYRPNGAADGLWWTVDVDGVETHVANVVGSASWSTGYEGDQDRPRSEQRHFIETTAGSVEFDGTSVMIHGSYSI